MYGGHVFPCQSYIWSTTVLHNIACGGGGGGGILCVCVQARMHTNVCTSMHNLYAHMCVNMCVFVYMQTCILVSVCKSVLWA